MRTLSPGLKTHLQADATTLCYCWRLIRKDGHVLGFTEHDCDLGFAGTTFLAASGFAASETVHEEGFSAVSNQVAGGFSSAAIDEAELAAGSYDGAKVEVYLVNWARPEDHQRLDIYEIGEVSRQAGAFKAELRSVTHRLSQPQGRSFSRRCDAELGDSRCGVDVAHSGLQMTGAIADVDTETRLVVSGGAVFPNGFFSFGVLVFESGQLAGQKADIEVNKTVGGAMQVDLWLPLERVPETGDAVRLVAGCDKAFSTCRNKFSNQLNFRGFPHMPGADFAYSYVDGESTHDGSVLFK
ncbi:DUF2163 domain-containing protein [Martelella mediterranea]|uniref:Putative phage protein (TIGR02218 family) n=1 Tax=Martelella mediterranea TaxID=293089 RepID=A0A4R3NUI5_9HYPH|nr:DUF2163 domain-containing protein [Martelella mediterranea]TCT40978.1 putative phage protein (TIGR02218 family) [Martelella mediterranea]